MAIRSARGTLLGVMCIGMFLVQLDVSIVNVASKTIGERLGAGTAGLQGVVDGYMVAFAAMMLPAGALTDRVGTRRTVLVGLAGFSAASLAAGLAPSIGPLVTARIVQGIAAAVLLPSTLAVLNQTFTRSADRARAIGIWAGVSALALPAGPLVGGWLCAHGSWRWIFLINVPICIVSIPACATLLSPTPLTGHRQRSVNYVNAAAFGAGLTSVVFVSITAEQHNWAAASLFAAAGVVLSGATCVLDRRSSSPLIPAALRTSPDFVVATLVAAVMNFVGIGMVFVLPLYLQVVGDATPLSTGTMMLPLFVPLAACAPLIGRITARTGPYPPVLAGLALGIAGCVVLTTVTTATPYPIAAVAMLGIGMGMAFLTPAVVTLAMQSAPTELSGIAAGVNNTARQAAGAVGVAVFGALIGFGNEPHAFTGRLRACALVAITMWTMAAVLVGLRKVHSYQRRPDTVAPGSTASGVSANDGFGAVPPKQGSGYTSL